MLKPCGIESTVGTTIRVKHYTPDRERIQGGLLNGGTTLAFNGGADLMFLRHVEGNLYEPLSGQTFPDVSVYRVKKPFE